MLCRQRLQFRNIIPDYRPATDKRQVESVDRRTRQTEQQPDSPRQPVSTWRSLRITRATELLPILWTVKR